MANPFVPVVFKVNKSEGAVVPIPIFPEAVILIFSLVVLAPTDVVLKLKSAGILVPDGAPATLASICADKL